MEHIQTEFIDANPENSNQPQIHFPTRNKKNGSNPWLEIKNEATPQSKNK
jgi:hypothetical protein